MSDSKRNDKLVAHGIFVPCPSCGHDNIPSRKPVEVCKLFITDKLPPCKKCGKPISSRNLKGLPEDSVYMKRARRELEQIRATI